MVNHDNYTKFSRLLLCINYYSNSMRASLIICCDIVKLLHDVKLLFPCRRRSTLLDMNDAYDE